MAKFSNLTLTTQGGELLALAQNGETINFSKVAVGDGELGANVLADLTALINQKQLANLSHITVSGNKATLRAVLSNKTTTADFYMRELGIFAKDSSGTEILYAVANAGSNAELFPAYGGSNVTMIVWDLVLTISNASSITAEIDETVIYVPRDEFEAHIEAMVYGASAPHGFAAAQPTDSNDGQVLAWDKTQAKHIYKSLPQKVTMTGTISHGGTIPLPDGYTQAQCYWFVIPREFNNYGSYDIHEFACYANANRVVTLTSEGHDVGNTGTYFIRGEK
jgi:phage-related tail fiber protein